MQEVKKSERPGPGQAPGKTNPVPPLHATTTMTPPTHGGAEAQAMRRVKAGFLCYLPRPLAYQPPVSLPGPSGITSQASKQAGEWAS